MTTEGTLIRDWRENPEQTGRWFVRGAGLGAAAGFAFGAALASTSEGIAPQDRWVLGVGAIAGAVVGGAVGGVAGFVAEVAE